MNLVARAKAILLTPAQEWPVIEKETTTAAELYTGYIVPLAAIGPVARAIGSSMIGVNLGPLGYWKVSPAKAVGREVVSYVFALAGCWVLAWIIDTLAPKFGGQSNFLQALKVAAYSATASWVFSVFFLVPALAVLSILGLYSLYLLYLGLPVLMKAPSDKALGYFAVVILAAILVFGIAAVLAAAVFPYGRPGLTLGLL